MCNVKKKSEMKSPSHKKVKKFELRQIKNIVVN